MTIAVDLGRKATKPTTFFSQIMDIAKICKCNSITIYLKDLQRQAFTSSFFSDFIINALSSVINKCVINSKYAWFYFFSGYLTIFAFDPNFSPIRNNI